MPSVQSRRFSVSANASVAVLALAILAGLYLSPASAGSSGTEVTIKDGSSTRTAKVLAGGLTTTTCRPTSTPSSANCAGVNAGRLLVAATGTMRLAPEAGQFHSMIGLTNSNGTGITGVYAANTRFQISQFTFSNEDSSPAIITVRILQSSDCSTGTIIDEVARVVVPAMDTVVQPFPMPLFTQTSTSGPVCLVAGRSGNGTQRVSAVLRIA